jgi:hypothetical protein
MVAFVGVDHTERMQSPGLPPGHNRRPQACPFDMVTRHPLASAKDTTASMSLSGCVALGISARLFRTAIPFLPFHSTLTLRG